MHAQNRAPGAGGAAFCCQATDAPADTTGNLIDKKSANEFNQELEHDIEDHQVTMALIARFEKAGRV